MKNKGMLAEPGHGSRRKPASVKMIFCAPSLAVLCMTAVVLDNAAEDCLKAGLALESIGSWDEATRAYDKAISLNPDYADAWCDKFQAKKIM
jgi:tetratricopeptide (TPR) repeat protein